MELWLLGAGGIVLIAIAFWLVWPAQGGEPIGAGVREEDRSMMPQGDEFEDQYTSATADLSAGGVARTINAADGRDLEPPLPTPYGAAGESGSSPTLAHEATPATARVPMPGSAPSAATAASAHPSQRRASTWQWSTEPPTGRWATRGRTSPRTIGMGAAAMLTIGGAMAGAWLYARWQRRRNQPLNRLRRGLYDARDQLR